MKVIGFLLLVYLFFAALGVAMAICAIALAIWIVKRCTRLFTPSAPPTRR